MKLFLGISEVEVDISLVYGSSVSKRIIGGKGVIIWVSMYIEMLA